MLSTSNTFSDIAVKDLEAAKKFYQDTLGLEVLKEDEWEIYFKTGNGKMSVYKSEYAGTNKATYMSWEVADIAAEAEGLKAKGVVFEHYDMPGVTMEDDVHVMGDTKAAWFKDPDGNILCLTNA